MIGDGWDGEPSVRPGEGPALDPTGPDVRRVAVVTGTRAEFGLLATVMRAVQEHPKLGLLTIAAGSHLIGTSPTFYEVKAAFPVADVVPMQRPSDSTRADDAEALGRGVSRFARAFERLRPDWVVVLGDRIEAFAAAAAASVGGWALAHIHGGDRAEGIADEAMRHAITKLAHLHFPATAQSAERIVRMGERRESVHQVGSPAVDDLAAIPPLPDDEYEALGRPEAVFLMHPIGRTPEREELAAAGVLSALAGRRVLALHPNHDPGREGVLRAIEGAGVPHREHLPRGRFVGLLKRLAAQPEGVLVGNSSAGLIEAAVLRLPAVDVGPRQAGRERPPNVLTAAGEAPEAVARAIEAVRRIDREKLDHPYGPGETGRRIADVLARTDPHAAGLVRKHCAY